MRKKRHSLCAIILAAAVAMGGLQMPVQAAGPNSIGQLQAEGSVITEPESAADAFGQPSAAEAALAADAEFTYLSDLDWVSASSGWKSIQKDKDVGGNSLNFSDGSTYGKGIGAHAASSVVYDLDGAYGRFTGLAGIDNDKVNGKNTAPCKFQVWGDDKLIWESQVMGEAAGNYGPEPFDVILAGVKTLRLDTVLLGDANTSCWTNWADAKLYAQIEESLLLSDLKVGGEAVEGFDPLVFRYTKEIEAEDLDKIDQLKPLAVEAIGKEGAQVAVTQAGQVPGTAVVTVSNDTGVLEYYVDFKVKDVDFLGDLPPVKTDGNGIRVDTDAQGNPIQMLGTAYRKGIGMQADSAVTYHLDGKYVKFRTSYGLNDGLMEDSYARGVFQIKCDGVVRHRMAINLDDQGWHDVLTEINVEKVQTLELSLTREEEGSQPIYGSWGNAMAVRGEPSGTLLSEILVDGKPLPGFADNVMAYEVPLNAGTVKVPSVEARAQEADAQVEVIPAAAVPGTTVIRVTRGKNVTEYTIYFRLRDEGLESIEVELDHTSINPVKYYGQTGKISVKANLGTGEVLTEKDKEVEISYDLTTLKSSGGVEIAEVDGKGVITPLKNEAHVAEGAEEAWNGGTGKVTVTVTVDGKTLSKDVPFAVTPFWVDYSKTLVMKMDFHMMARNNAVNMNFGDALEIIKKYDNVTRGIPKIVYMVGWQSDGHDTGYPSWDEVDEYLKIPGMTAKESLAYLMQEAKKYNTTVSFHLNMTTTYTDSPLYDEYFAKDILGRRADGGQTVYGEGGVISYTRDWELGTMQRRMERLVETYPTMAEGHTVHSDAFHIVVPQSTTGFGKAEPVSQYAQDKYGYSRSTDIESMRKMFQYWRTLGLDLTSEFVDSYRPSDVSGNEAFIGLQPMAWHFRKTATSWNMDIPATLYTGGDGGSPLFGTSHNPEGSLLPGKSASGWLSDFASSTLSWQYLNHFDRISATDNSVQFSDGVTTENTAKGVVIKEDGKVLAEGTDYFIPALWKEESPEVIAYSKGGYKDREWELPRGWEGVKAADVYEITGNEMAQPAMTGVDISNGKITLSIAAGKGYSVVPAGTDMSRKWKHVQEVRLAEKDLALAAGERKKLHAQVMPEGATDQGIRWQSSNPKVAEVSNASIVTAKTAGTAVITGTSVDGGKTASCTVTVQGNMEEVAPLTADKASGAYEGPIEVSLSTGTAGADIFYTLDGTQPDETSLYYSPASTNPAPIKVIEDTVIKAVAMKDGMIDSEVLQLEYRIQDPGVGEVHAIAQPDHYTSTQAVFLTSATPDADIYFTVDGTEPSKDSQTSIRYNTSSPLTLNSDTTVKAIAYKDGKASPVKSFAYTFTDQTARVLTPYVKVNGKIGMGGIYEGPVTIELESRTPGATVYYTTNGQNPGTNSTKYTGPITVEKSMNLKVLAAANGMTNSNYGWFNFIIGGTEENRVAPAEASVAQGAYKEPFALRLSTATPGAVVKYTISGRTPRLYTASYQESIPLLIEEDLTVTAISYKNGMIDGPVRKFRYSIDPEHGAEIQKTAAMPTASVASGTYETEQEVELATATEGAAIHYTTDGSEPTAASPVYKGSIKVAESMVIKAIAVKEGYQDSQVAVFTYEIDIEKPIVDPKENEVYLSDLDWKWAYAGTRSDTTPMFGDEANITGSHNMPQKDMRYEKSQSWSPTTDMHFAYDALKGVYSWDSIASSEHTKKMEKGIGTAACSEIVYELAGDYTMFRAIIGFDASVLTNRARPSSVQFKVLGSKTEDIAEQYETLYESQVAYTSDAGGERPYFVPEEIEVSTEGYQYLKLWVYDAGETGSGGANAPNQSDAVNWAYARVEKMPPADTAGLREKVAEAESYLEADYTSTSWQALAEALQEAKGLLQETEPKQSEVNAAQKKLEDAISHLEQKAADTSSLEEKITQARAFEASDYTSASWESLEKALGEAEEILKGQAPKQSEVDAARKKLEEAISHLEQKAADTGRLEGKLTEAKQLKPGDYTSASWARLEKALTEAESTLQKPAPKQSEVDAAYKSLEEAINALEKAPAAVDKSSLQKKVNEAKALKSSDYTSASWNVLKVALQEAEAILGQAHPSQAQVDAAWKKLDSAIRGLKKPTPVTPVKKPGTVKARAAAGSTTSIKVTWNQASNAEGYQILVKTGTSKPWKAVKTIKGKKTTSWTHKNLKVNRYYYYKVQAYRMQDGKMIKGTASKAVKAKPVPAATKKVTAKRKSNTISLSWKKVSKASGYYVYRKTSGASKWQKVATVKGQGKVKYTDKKIKKNKAYSYRIYAYKTVKGKKVRGLASKDVLCKK